MLKKLISLKDLLNIIVSALIYAVAFEIFVFPNEFAPAGIPGIETMIQQIWHFPMSIMNALINIPLVILTFIIVDKGYAVKSGIYSLFLSGWMIFMEQFNLEKFIYVAPGNPLGPLAGGILCGVSVAMVLRRGSCTGGTDLVAELIHHYRPQTKMVWALFGLNASVAVVSYFVYDCNIEPVMMCLLYCFTLSQVSDLMLRGWKEAVKFEIITEHPEELVKTLIEEIGHGVTEIPAIGSFTRQEKTLLICVVNKNQIATFQRILQRFPGTFAYLHTITETMGYFKKEKK